MLSEKFNSKDQTSESTYENQSNHQNQGINISFSESTIENKNNNQWKPAPILESSYFPWIT